MLRVQVVSAWPGRHHAVELELAAGTTVAAAVAASGLSLEGIAGFAVFGQRATADTALADGDRVELLRPLSMDPKEARRRRAQARAAAGGSG